MSFTTSLRGGLAAICLVATPFAPAFAGDIVIEDGYARAASVNARSGAAFLVIRNDGTADDRLTGAASDAAQIVQLHTHEEGESGVMRMRHVPEGFALPAGGRIEMRRGGRHVMFMGLTQPFEQGAEIPLTLIFEKAGEMEIEVPVDLERGPAKDGHGHGHKHGHDMAE